MRSFIWIGDIENKKLVIMARKIYCIPTSECGIGLRHFISISIASNLKLCQDFVNSNDHWAKLVKFRALRQCITIYHHIFSSIWSGVNESYNTIISNSIWTIGNGREINFWLDDWCGNFLAQSLNIPIVDKWVNILQPANGLSKPFMCYQSLPHTFA